MQEKIKTIEEYITESRPESGKSVVSAMQALQAISQEINSLEQQLENAKKEATHEENPQLKNNPRTKNK